MEKKTIVGSAFLSSLFDTAKKALGFNKGIEEKYRKVRGKVIMELADREVRYDENGKIIYMAPITINYNRKDIRQRKRVQQSRKGGVIVC